MKKFVFRIALGAAVAVLPLSSAAAQTSSQHEGQQKQAQQHQAQDKQGARQVTGTAGVATHRNDYRTDLKEATTVARKMTSQSEAKMLLERAKGVLLVPDYGRAALGVGGAGGEGVLLARTNGHWSDPVFVNIGSISLGAQAGVTAGQLAFILMTDNAINSFKGQNTFSLNADAGLTIVNWSARSQASLGKADVVLWSDTEGAFAGVSVSAGDVSADSQENQAYYGTKNVNPGMILDGKVSKSTPEADALKGTL